MTTDTAEFKFERTIATSPDRLWHLLTDAEMRGQWAAPGPGKTLTTLKEDFRVGGEEHHRCGPQDAPEFHAATRWYRIEAPTDAAFTETIDADGMTIVTSLVTYRVTPAENGASTLHATVAVSSFVGPDAPAEFQAGWSAGLDNLEALVARISA